MYGQNVQQIRCPNEITTQCPVCTLYLNPGMSLESHLETHPKEQVIKALVAMAMMPKAETSGPRPQNSATTSQVSKPSNAIIYGNLAGHIIQTPQIAAAIEAPPPQQKFVIVNSTSTKFFQSRQNSAYIVNDNASQNKILFNASFINNHQAVCPETGGYDHTEPIDRLSLTETDDSQQQHQQLEYNENETENYYDDGENIVDEEENQLQQDEVVEDENAPFEANYYEQENGEFIVEESPKTVVEYHEAEDGEFHVTKRKVSTSPPLNVIQFKNVIPTTETPLDVVESTSNLTNQPPGLILGNNETSGKKSNCPRLQVISNVKLSPSITSTNIKELIMDKHSTKVTEIQTTMKIEVGQEAPVTTVIRNMSEPDPNLKITEILCPDEQEIPPPPRPSSVIKMVTNDQPEVVVQKSNEEFFREPDNTKTGESSKCLPSNTTHPAYPPKKNCFFNKAPKKLVVKLKTPLPIDDIKKDSTPIQPEAIPSTSKASIEAHHNDESSINLCSQSDDPSISNHKDSEEDRDVEADFADVESPSCSTVLISKSPPPVRPKKKLKPRIKFYSMLKSQHIAAARNRRRFNRKIKQRREPIPTIDIETESEEGNYRTAPPPAVQMKVERPEPEIDISVEETTSEILDVAGVTVTPTTTAIKPEIEEVAEVVVEVVETTLNQIKTETTICQFESWASQLTSAIQTIESHNSPQHHHQISDNPVAITSSSSLSEQISSSSSSYQHSQYPHTSSSSHNYPPPATTTATQATEVELIWKSFSNHSTTSNHNYNDMNQAGPSRINYHTTQDHQRQSSSNFFVANYDESGAVGSTTEYIFPNEKNNRFMEFIEDGQTATWRNTFSPQYVNFENDRNSYMDLDACKTNNSAYNRATSASTESLNIRTDEKMPAKGEISEQESNGEVDISWNNHQIYPSSYYQQDSLARHSSTTPQDLSVLKEEDWKPIVDNNLTSFSHNLPKFPSLPSSSEAPPVMPRPIEIKKEIVNKPRKPPTYKCPVCDEIFPKLILRRSHMKIHPTMIIAGPRCTSTKKTCTITSSSNLVLDSSQIKQEGEVEIASSLVIATASVSNQENPHVFNAFEVVKPSTNTADELKQVIGYDELKNELLQGSNGLSTVKSEINGKNKKLAKVYVCHKCKEEFNRFKLFNAHLQVHPIECLQCDKIFHNWTNLVVHMKRHLGIKAYECNVCGKRFVMKQKLDEHLRIHTGEAPITCLDCGKKFKRYSNLSQHRNRHHLNIKKEEKDYVCQCGDVFHSKAKFEWHKEIHDKKPKGCPFCRERFIHQNSLKRHIRLSHAEKYWFHRNQSQGVQCPICNQLYLKSSIKHHLRTHNIKNEFKCNICSKVFSTKWNLKQHRWIHACRNSKPFKCNICSAAFVRETDYNTHINVHKAVKPFTCDHCGCQFSRKYNWLRHSREHVLPKKFECTICNKTFHRAYYLNEHSRVHSGLRPFSCNICGKTSTTKSNHNKHIVIHHARDPCTAEG